VGLWIGSRAFNVLWLGLLYLGMWWA
jgi:hypothetical protein